MAETQNKALETGAEKSDNALEKVPTTASQHLEKVPTTASQRIEKVPTKEERWQQAAYEGHDADIPSNIGVLDEKQMKDVELGAEDRSSTETLDPNIVWWDGPDDPENPMNWTTGKKVGTIAIVSAITFVAPLASSMFAPAVPQLMEEFKSDNLELASFVVSVYVLGFAVGPIVLAPLSEMYGRLLWYNICNLLFVVFTVACALSKNMNMLIGFRFLAGCMGAAPLTIGGGSIADLIAQEKRGAAMATYALGPLMGPVIGPVAGGYLAASKGWRWVFWVLAILSGTIAIITLVFMRETYAITILERKTKRLRKETGNQSLRSKLDSGKTPAQLFKFSIIRPLKMLAFSPIVLGLSLMMAINYGYLYLLFTTFDLVFHQQYGFSTGTIGLTYLGIGIGSLLGLIVFGIASDRVLKSKSAKGEMKPEYRLPPLIYGAPLVPIGLFWYGWSAQAKVHWIVPILGTLVVGLGMLSYFMSVQTYLVDAFTVYAASALAANTILRSIVGAVLPLAGQKMYKALGVGWGNSLLAFIALAGCPVPILFYIYGERIRKRFRVNF